LPRFFLPESFPLSDVSCLPECIELSGEDAFHLSVSLRARVGDPVLVCTASAIEISCRIESITGGKKDPRVFLVPQSMQKSQTEPPLDLTVYQAIPKGKKTDSIIQKCTELGAGRLVFVYSDHAVPTGDGEEKKISRFQRIAEEAAKQCGRGKLVPIEFLGSTEEAIAQMKQADLSFFCYEQEGENGLKKLLSSCAPFSSVSFFIGPEGGISPREAALFETAEIPAVTLGKRILRTETAATAVLSMILYETEL